LRRQEIAQSVSYKPVSREAIPAISLSAMRQRILHIHNKKSLSSLAKN